MWDAETAVTVVGLVLLAVGTISYVLLKVVRRQRGNAMLTTGTGAPAVLGSDHARPASAAPVSVPVVDLTALADGLNVVIIGPKNSGKTTTLNALLRLREGYALALDPHNEPGKWPVDVAGGGMQWAEVHTRLLAAYETMIARYGAANRGERPQSSYQAPSWRFSLVGDEWGSITKEIQGSRATRERPAVPGAGELLGKLLAQGRKVGVGVFVAAHDDTAAQLGLDGEMGLVGCFDYLIYLGAQATGNTTIPAEVRQLARRMPRPAVVLDTNYRNWGLLMLDNLNKLRPASSARYAAPADFAGAVRRIETEQDNVLAGLLAGVAHQAGGVMAQNSGVPRADAVRAGGVGVPTPVQEAETAPPSGGHTGTPTPAHESQAITLDELRRLTRAVELVHAGESMTQALCQAFETKKGSTNPRWLRARWLWKQAMEVQGAPVEDDDAADMGNVSRLSRVA